MRKSAIAVIIVIAAIVGGIGAMSAMTEDEISNTPGIADSLELGDGIELNLDATDSPVVTEQVDQGGQTDSDVNYTTDEDGKKHYTISAIDVPILED